EMMPKGPQNLKLSKMNMLGIGTAMMKNVMKNKNVSDLQTLIDNAIKGGVEIIACSMSMDVMGLNKDELIDGISIGGVATFLSESNSSSATLFI
ncbi:MAG TPA: DsrE/DsrF/DrsH-like family protein, partial [Victivallales bacterium]|nr:DsrE/DsrF/DrsH-like family protein [Victivallales bacterium]